MCARPSERSESTRTAEELARRADAIRADMKRTLDALERKLAPERLFDRPLSLLTERGRDLRQTIGAVMRRNPLPIALTLAGITWLAIASYNRRQPPGQDLPSRLSYSGVGQKLQTGASRVRERLQSARTAVRERLRSRRKGNGELEELEAETETDRERAHLAEQWHSTRASARARAQQAQDRFQTMIEENPLMVGALAVAIGAIIGTLIPATQYEHRKLGRARERALTKAQELGEQRYEEVRESLQSSGAHQDSESPLAGRA